MTAITPEKSELKVLPTTELDPSITYAKFQNGDQCSLDVNFDEVFTERLFAYSIGKHLPHLLKD